MTHDQLYEACESLSGITIGDFTVYWDYPGFLNLNRAEFTTESGYGYCVIATPDFANGEHTRIVFQLDYDGLVLSMPDITGVVWEKGKVEETFRAAVARRLPEIKTLLEAAHDHGLGGVEAFDRALGVHPYMDPARAELQLMYLEQLEDEELTGAYMRAWERVKQAYGEEAARANWAEFQAQLPAEQRCDTDPEGN